MKSPSASSQDPAASDIRVRCPGCRQELHLRLPDPQAAPDRLHLQCGACQARFWARRSVRNAEPEPVTPRTSISPPPPLEPPREPASEPPPEPSPEQEPSAEPSPAAPKFERRPRPFRQPSARAQRWRKGAARGLWVALGLLVLVMVASVVSPSLRDFVVSLPEVRKAPPVPAEAVLSLEGRPALAVLPAVNLDGDAGGDWLSTAVAEAVSLRLGRWESLRVVPGSEVATMMRDLHLRLGSAAEARDLGRPKVSGGGPRVRRGEAAEAESLQELSPATLGRIGRHLGVGSVAELRFRRGSEGEGWTLEGRIRDLAGSSREGSGESSIPWVSVPAPVGRLVAAAQDLADRLGEALPAVAPAGTEIPEPPGVQELPELPALRELASGLEALRLGDLGRAQQLLERAVEAAPLSPRAHEALAEVWLAQGYRSRALKALEQAVAVSAAGASDDAGASGEPGDPRRKPSYLARVARRRFLEGAEGAGAAAALYRSLRQRFPDEVRWGLAEVRSALEAGDGGGAAAAVVSMRAAPLPVPRDPRVYLAAAAVAARRADFQDQLSSAQRARELAHERDLEGLRGTASLVEAEALLRLGDAVGAEGTAEQARSIFEATGDRVGVARADNALAVARLANGNPSGASQAYARALSGWRRLGHLDALAVTLTNQARSLGAQGHPVEAEGVFEQALRLREQLEDPAGAAELWRARGALRRDGGDLAEAERAYRQALKAAEDSGKPVAQEAALLDLAAVLSARERLAPAREIYLQALVLGRGDNRRGQEGSSQSLRSAEGDARRLRHRALAQAGLAELDLLAGDLAAARGRQEEVLEIRRRLEDEVGTAQGRLALVALDVELGSLEGGAAVESLGTTLDSETRELIAAFRAARDPVGEIATQLLRARGLLLLGEPAQARQAVDLAGERLGPAAAPTLQLAWLLASARVDAARGDRLRARHQLEELLARTLEGDQVGAELEVRLALGEIELAGDQRRSGRSRLQAVERDARARGYGLLARKAARALAGG